MKMRTWLAAMAMASAALPSAVLGVDGVVLIDQNKALAGNVTPGDAPGFPVTLTQPGSFRLSGNLTLPAAADGFVVAASGVTLDLNGFTITGAGGATRGITDDSVARSRVAIRNGNITGFPAGIRLQVSNRVTVQEVTADPGPGGLAIVVGPYSRVQRNTSGNNGLIQATCPSIVTENITAGFITVFVTDGTQQCIRWHNRSEGFGDPINE